MKLKIAQFGVGPIGLQTLKLAAEKSWARVIGAVEIDPGLVGKSLSSLTGVQLPKAAVVHPSLESLLSSGKPDIILHTSVSRLKDAFEQIEPMVRQGISVVSSCEELVFPGLREPKLAGRLDRLCRQHGARVVGTGINPGFVMDVLPLVMTGVSAAVDGIRVTRVVDASTRREPLQRKIGSGRQPEEFRQLLREGKAGHAGLKESLALIAHCLGWELEGIRETSDAVIAARDIRTTYFHVRKGQVCGIHQTAEGAFSSGKTLSLDIQMYLGAKDPRDAISIQGDPPVETVVEGGVAGDRATVAALVNSAARILTAPPGLLLMTDLPLPRIAPA